MRIAQLAPLTESVPPKGYGGTELVIHLLTEGLVEAGHEVTLFASGDSETSAELVSVAGEALRLDRSIPMRRWSAYSLKQMLEFEERQSEFDIVHSHMGYESFDLLERIACPSVLTNHNPVRDYCAPLYFAHAKLNYVAISNAYRKLNYGDKLNYAATIHNGIDIEKHILDTKKERTYLLFIGRVCKDKGTADAIEIAKKLKMPLKIAGKVDDADKEYFERLVKPQLDPPNIEYVGEVNFEQKNDLYQGAIAVVYPIAFEEPFGLVIAESIAMGAPVVALERGSVSELIVDGKTGVIGKSIDELIGKFEMIKKISAEECRTYAEQNFSKEKMVNEYIKLYERLCKEKTGVKTSSAASLR